MDISRENRDEIVALLNQGICPICNKSFLNILKHIARSHSISAKDVKDILLLPRGSSFIPGEQREKHRQTAVKHNFKSKFTPGGKGKKPDSATREKMREKAIINLKNNPDHLKALQEARQKAQSKAIEKSNETNRKSVVRVSPDGKTKTYKSIAEAERDGNVHNSNISRCIKEKRLDCNRNRWYLLEDFNAKPQDE